MQLKLAEYNLKDGKFEKFLELGRDFVFGGEFILFVERADIQDAIQLPDYISKKDFYFIDEKDPLNRFNGLFDGRTYGEGRFVLIRGDEDDIYHFVFPYRGSHAINFEVRENKYFPKSQKISAQNTWESAKEAKITGNLHENPELWEKIK